MKKYNDILWISGGQIISLLANFMLLKVLTTFLGMAEYGYYVLYMSLLLFLRQIIYDPYSTIIAKEAIGSKSLGLNSFCALQIARHATDAIFIVIVSLVVATSIINPAFDVNHNLVLCATMGLIYLASNGAQGIYLNILNTLGERKWAAIGIMADSSVKLIFIASIFYFHQKSLVVTVQAVAASSLFVFLWIRKISEKFNNELLMGENELNTASKKIILMSLPLFAPTLLSALKGVGDKAFMIIFIGAEELAAYNVLMQIGFIPIMLIAGVIQTYSGPQIYKLTAAGNVNKKKTISHIGKIIFYIFLLASATFIASLILSNLIFNTLVGVEYYKYSEYLPYFVLGGALSGISALLNIAVIGAFKSKTAGVLMLASVLSGLIIFIAAIAIFGFQGGVAGLIFSNLIMMIIFGGSLLLMKFDCSN